MSKPEGSKHSPVAQIDFAKPFYAVLHQTETRNVVTFHQGEDALSEAKAEASRRAASHKRPVAVIGPQRSVYQPPREPVAEEFQMKFRDA
jgi:hypothetical protein